MGFADKRTAGSTVGKLPPDGCQASFQAIFIVGMQRFAIGEAEQRGAIVDLGRQLRLVCLRVRDGGEPGTECMAVLRGVETKKIGSSIAVAVAGVEDEAYRNMQSAMAPEQMQLKVARSYGG